MSDSRTSAASRLDGLSIVLPCFDEEASVESTVHAALTAAARVTEHCEIVVVDDGSTDDTAIVARALAARDPRVRLVSHGINRGYGAAVRTGIAASRMPWVLLSDADGQFDFSDLPQFAAAAADSDLVAGYRAHRQDPLHRRVAAACWNRHVRRRFGVRVRDVDCAFKLVRGERLRSLPLGCEGAMVSTELVVRAHQDHWRISELSVTHLPRLSGESSGGRLHVVVRALREAHAFARQLEHPAEPDRGKWLPRLRPLGL